MPFDSGGNFTRVHNWQTDRDNGLRILAQRMDAEFDNFATAMNQVFLRNGVVPMTADLNMSGNAIGIVKAGSPLVPGITFELDPETGIYQSAPGHINIGIDNAAVIDFSSTGVNVTGAVTASGNITGGGDVTSPRARLTSTTDLALAAGNNALVTGTTAGTNLAFDRSRIQARNNGAASTLTLNPLGGNVTIGAGTFAAGGNATVAGTLTSTGKGTFNGGIDVSGAVAITGLLTASNTTGFDADLLDGQHGSYYRNAGNLNAGTVPNGRLSGGYTGIWLDIAVGPDGYGIHMKNNDIVGANGIYFNDTSNLAGEGLNFIKSGATTGSTTVTDYDQLRGPGDGTLLWNGNELYHTGVTELTNSRIRLTSSSDVSLASTSHAFQIGLDSGENIAADRNEVQARNNGVAANLNLQLEGGVVNIGSGGITTSGTVTTPRLEIDTNFYSYMSGANPTTYFDANDYLWYSRSENMYRFRVAGVTVLAISAAGIDTVAGTVSDANGNVRADGDMTDGTQWWYEVRLQNGERMRRCGGSVSMTADSTQTITMPTTMNIRSLFASSSQGTTGDDGNVAANRLGASTTQFTLVNGMSATRQVDWEAVGYL